MKFRAWLVLASGMTEKAFQTMNAHTNLHSTQSLVSFTAITIPSSLPMSTLVLHRPHCWTEEWNLWIEKRREIYESTGLKCCHGNSTLTSTEQVYTFNWVLFLLGHKPYPHVETLPVPFRLFLSYNMALISHFKTYHGLKYANIPMCFQNPTASY